MITAHGDAPFHQRMVDSRNIPSFAGLFYA